MNLVDFQNPRAKDGLGSQKRGERQYNNTTICTILSIENWKHEIDDLTAGDTEEMVGLETAHCW